MIKQVFREAATPALVSATLTGLLAALIYWNYTIYVSDYMEFTFTPTDFLHQSTIGLIGLLFGLLVIYPIALVSGAIGMMLADKHEVCQEFVVWTAVGAMAGGFLFSLAALIFSEQWPEQPFVFLCGSLSGITLAAIFHKFAMVSE